MKDFFQQCGCGWFPVYRRPFNAILAIKDGKLRSSVYKLYRWLCSKQTRTWNNDSFRTEYSYKPVTVSLEHISNETGLSKPAIIRARRQLEHMKLITVDEDRGDGAYCVRAVGTVVDNGHKVHDSYFPVP